MRGARWAEQGTRGDSGCAVCRQDPPPSKVPMEFLQSRCGIGHGRTIPRSSSQRIAFNARGGHEPPSPLQPPTCTCCRVARAGGPAGCVVVVPPPTPVPRPGPVVVVVGSGACVCLWALSAARARPRDALVPWPPSSFPPPPDPAGECAMPWRGPFVGTGAAAGKARPLAAGCATRRRRGRSGQRPVAVGGCGRHPAVGTAVWEAGGCGAGPVGAAVREQSTGRPSGRPPLWLPPLHVPRVACGR